MSTQNPKHEVMSLFARVAKALAHEHRLELLEQLAQGGRSVEALAASCDLPLANVSQHLQHLRRAGLVVGRRDGKYVRYRISGSDVVTLQSVLRSVAERHLAEVRDVVGTYFHARDELEPVAMDELLERARDGLVTVIDVRPQDEFAQGHVPGALNIPLEELERHLQTLPRDTEIVAYCRGPYCLLAYEAVARLRREGLRARRMEEGFPEWRAAGRPVEASELAGAEQAH
jgi:rhodanese-related sulfurtransferase/biotin operon repressor